LKETYAAAEGGSRTILHATRATSDGQLCARRKGGETVTERHERPSRGELTKKNKKNPPPGFGKKKVVSRCGKKVALERERGSLEYNPQKGITRSSYLLSIVALDGPQGGRGERHDDVAKKKEKSRRDVEQIFLDYKHGRGENFVAEKKKN